MLMSTVIHICHDNDNDNNNDNDNGLFSKIWFLMEYVRDYTILYLQYIIYTDNTLVL